MRPNPPETADLVTFTEEILNGNKLLVTMMENFIFLYCAVIFLL